MALYAAIGFDQPPHAMARRNAMRAAHRAYVLVNAAPLRCAGAMRDDAGNQCGTIYVFEAASEAEVLDWLRKEPFYAAGVYQDLRVVLWAPAFNVLARADWPT